VTEVVDADRPTVLVVEDDAELRELLGRLLAESGYVVDVAPDGQAGLHLGLTRQYQVLVVDRGLPGIDGVDLIRRLRRQGLGTPALILSAYGTVEDRVSGLDAGAEDYLVKPFDVDELLARLRALRRRHHDVAERIPLGTGWLDVTAHRVLLPDATEIELSGRECDLLAALASRPGRVFSREELLGRVFDTAESVTVVDTYVHYVRRKLGPGVVRTVRGLGYRIGGLK
jgi:two-component system response regulator QseB